MFESSLTPIIVIPVVLGILGFVFWFGKWVGAVNTDRTMFGNFVNEIRSDIKKILGRLPQVTVASTSPLRLTKIGEAISEKLEAGNWAKETALSVASKIEGKQPF